jgi:2-haloacid dehalogenase
MSEIRHIVFDIGKVLIHYDPELPYKRLIPDAERRSWFLGNVCTGDWNVEQDRGRTWREAEDEMVPYAYDGSVAILERLVRAGHDVTMLTNFAADTFVEARQRYPFLNLGRGVTVSGEVGMIKPDERIYRLHAENFGLDAPATLFIDDSAEECRGRT